MGPNRHPIITWWRNKPARAKPSIHLIFCLWLWIVKHLAAKQYFIPNVPLLKHSNECQTDFFCSRKKINSLWHDCCSRACCCLSPVFVYDGVEKLPIPPAAGEVVAAQALVSLHHPLGPEQQFLLGRHVVGLAVHLNVRNLRERERAPVHASVKNSSAHFLAKETAQRAEWCRNGRSHLLTRRQPVGWPVLWGVCNKKQFLITVTEPRCNVQICFCRLMTTTTTVVCDKKNPTHYLQGIWAQLLILIDLHSN